MVKSLDCGFFDGALHSLGLPIRPEVIRLGQLVDDAVFIADPAKVVHPQKSVDGPVAVLPKVVSKFDTDELGKSGPISSNMLSLPWAKRHSVMSMCT